VAWSLAVKGDKVTLTAHNSGDRRLRISALALRDDQLLAFLLPVLVFLSGDQALD